MHGNVTPIPLALSGRERRWVLVHVNAATPEQLRRMKALGVVVTTTPGFLYMAGDRYGLDTLGRSEEGHV